MKQLANEEQIQQIKKKKNCPSSIRNFFLELATAIKNYHVQIK